MGFLFTKKLKIFVQMWRYIKEKRRYWLLPVFFALILIGFVLLLAEGSIVAPFIYTVF